MPEATPAAPRRGIRQLGFAGLCATIMAGLLVLGAIFALLVLRSPSDDLPAEIPAPYALFSVLPVSVPGHGQGCMQTVTVTPQTHYVRFNVYPAAHAKNGGPPIALTFDGGGYHASIGLNGGYPGGIATLPLVDPPQHPTLVTACFVNHGTHPAVFSGSNEPSSVTRSYPMTVNGAAVPADISLIFLDRSNAGLRYRLTTAIDHASNLTDGLLAPGLIWIIGIALVLGVPLLFVAAWWRALSTPEPAREASAASQHPV